MSQLLNRRQALAGGLGVAGSLLTGKARTQAAASAAPLADRSAAAPTAPVSIQRCESYEPQLVRRQLDAALDQIGGLGPLVRGKTVTIKVNMTGPVKDLAGLPASRTYHIHPHVVGALCAALNAAGARRIAVVEALYYTKPVEEVLVLAGWDLPAIRSAGGNVVFENTKNLGSFPRYSRLPVPWGGYLFPAFDLNGWYEKTDVFVSLSKLKQHGTAGVTMSCKNSFGILPTALYGDDAPNEQTVKARMAQLHSGERTVPAGVPAELDLAIPREGPCRVPHIVADAVGARPIDLCIVDGIDSVRHGEGFWNKGVAPIQPKLLLAGRNPVCTDAVCTAVMGFDPLGPHHQPPYPGHNHLALLAQAGVGTNDPGRIEVRGLSMREALHPFAPPGEAKTSLLPRRAAPWA